MTDEKMDRMMKSYCNPQAEVFEYKPKKYRGLKAASVIAAALVLTVLGTLIIPSINKDSHNFVLTVNAASDRTENSQTGTIYSENFVYDNNMNQVDHYYVMDAEVMLGGDDIEDVSFRSLNGYGQFFVLYNPDPDDYHDDLGWWCDSEGNLAPDYVGWRTYDYDEYYNKAKIYPTNDWSKEYLYHIQYSAIDDDGYFLQPENATADRNDTIEIFVTFTNGDTLTKRLNVTYSDGVMSVEEIR